MVQLGLLVALLSSLFYSSELVIADKKLEGKDPMATTFFVGIGLVVFSGICLLIRKYGLGHQIIIPDNQTTWLWMLALVFLTWLADYTQYLALDYRAGAVALSMTYLLIPLGSAVLKWEKLSWQMITCFLLGAVMLYLLFSEKRTP